MIKPMIGFIDPGDWSKADVIVSRMTSLTGRWGCELPGDLSSPRVNEGEDAVDGLIGTSFDDFKGCVQR